MTIGGHLRSFATKLFPRSALFRSSSSSMPQTQCRAPPLVTPSEVATWVVFGAVYHASIKWLSFHGGNMYEARIAEKMMQDRLEELDRITSPVYLFICPSGDLFLLSDEFSWQSFTAPFVLNPSSN